VALFSGVLTPGSTAARPFDEEGVTCITCHSIQSVSSTRGLGSYILGKPAVMLDASGNPAPGLPSPEEIRANPERHRAAMMRPLLQSPEFCGSCHKANLPKSLNGYKWLRAFTTYDEWQQSGWSMQSPIAFFPKSAARTCQDCHMPKVETADVAAKTGALFSHRWAAANTAIPTQYGYEDQLAEVMRFLRTNALRVDIFALSEDKGPAIAPVDKSSFALRGGQPVTVSVVVQNTGIGHSLVPEQRDFYESWLSFEVRDETGKIIYESGAIEKDHTLAGDTHSYTNRILSGDGKRLSRHEVWQVEARAYDSTVNAGRADLERYCFTIPAGVKAVTLHAAVKYRRFRREFLDWAFDDAASRPDRFPTVTMAEDTVTLRIGDNQPQPDVKSAIPAMLRWTAYGIGLLDRQQIKQAVTVFETTAQLFPKRIDGYLNSGVALYTDGRYDEALQWLAKADKVDAGNMRARYYEGLCYRWQYQYAQATEKLSAVASAYPRFRQVHDDLGWIYLLEQKYPAARAEFEAALDVDPDDLTAHKWLGPVYTALGDHQRAAQEAERTAQIKDDPAAQWRVLAYWRAHQEVAREVAPGHIHGDDPGGRAEVQQMLNTQNPPSLVWIQR
jgi:tetratricopeptide (TPR) repeat protein